MSYGSRQYGETRYGTIQSLTYFRELSEALYMDSSVEALNLIEKVYSESLGLSEDRVFEVAAVYNEDLEISDQYSRVLDAFRTFQESQAMQPVFVSSSDLQRVYAESLVQEDVLGERVISAFYDESLQQNESILKTVEISRSEALELFSSVTTAALLERTYVETMEMAEERAFEVLATYFEGQDIKDKELVRGTDLIRIRNLDVLESLGMSDSQFRISAVRPVEIPDFTFIALEKYDILGVVGEPEVQSHVGEPEIGIDLIESEEDEN